MGKGNYNLNIPGLESLNHIRANIGDLKKEANKLKRKKRRLRLSMHAIDTQLNNLCAEIEIHEKEEKKL